MGKKSKSQKLNATADKAKNPDPMLDTKIKDVEPCVPKLAESNEKKQSNNKSINVRRSGRLRSLDRPAKYQEVECQIQELNPVESEREEEEPPVQDYVEKPMLESHETEKEQHNDDSHNEPTLSQMSLDKKVNDLIIAVEELKSKGRNGHNLGDDTSSNFNYKSLYFDSQKKISALVGENNELSRKLEIALAKLQVYEEIEKCTVKVMIPNMPKDTGAVVKLMSHVDQISSPDDVEPITDHEPKKLSPKKRRRDKTDN